MLVKVTQEHIDKGFENFGKKGTCQLCPIALALKETFKVSYSSVGPSRLCVGKFPEDNLIFEVPTPIPVFNWIENYDLQLKEPAPFEFELSLEGVKL